MFGKNLKRIMEERGITGTALAQEIGCSKASISQYINGINLPSSGRLESLATALGVSMEEVVGVEEKPEPVRESEPLQLFGRQTLSCREAAKLMGKHENYVRQGLRERWPGFEFGSAVKTSTKWSYCIYANKFSEITGIPVNI